MNSNLVLGLAFAIGVIAGLRALTAPMVVSWAAHLRWINLEGTHLSFMSSIITAAILTLLATGEIVNDKLPKTPPRTIPAQLGARIVTGGFAAATLSAGAGGSLIVGAILGIIGALVGTFGGYHARRGTVAALKIPDFVYALIEDVIAVGGGFFLASRL